MLIKFAKPIPLMPLKNFQVTCTRPDCFLSKSPVTSPVIIDFEPTPNGQKHFHLVYR